MTDEELQKRFTYCPSTEAHRPQLERIYDAALLLARIINSNTPRCRDQTEAVNVIYDGVRLAERAIVCEPAQPAPHTRE